MFDRTKTALVAAALFALPTFALAAVTTTTPSTPGNEAAVGGNNSSFAQNGHYAAHNVPASPATGTGNVLGGKAAASQAGEGGNGNGSGGNGTGGTGK